MVASSKRPFGLAVAGEGESEAGPATLGKSFGQLDKQGPILVSSQSMTEDQQHTFAAAFVKGGVQLFAFAIFKFRKIHEVKRFVPER